MRWRLRAWHALRRPRIRRTLDGITGVTLIGLVELREER